MKKILFVIQSLNIGGMERVQVDIANALVDRGYDVTILMYMPNEEINFIKDLDGRVHVLYKERQKFPIRSRLPYIHRFYNGIKWEKRASAKALYKYYVGKRNKYDVEVAFYRGPSVKIISGSTNKKSAKLAWVHNDYKLVDQKSITYFFNNMEEARKAYRRFDSVIAVSEQARRNFIDVIEYQGKSKIIYNMISNEKISKKAKENCPIKKEKFTIISVGRLIEAKGYDMLLSVVNKLNKNGYEFDLWLIGSGRCEKELKSYVECNNLQNVKFLGKQENPYMYMKEADLYVCSSWREGFAIVIAEAMSCGLPVISTECTGPSEVLGYGKYGVLVKNSENALYDALESALLDFSQMDSYSEKSMKRSKDFDEKVIVEQIVSVFNEICKEKK